MEKLAASINLAITALLVLSAAFIFFASTINGNVPVAIIGGALTLIGVQILKITIDERK